MVQNGQEVISMGVGARLLIARKSMPRAGWRGSTRLCPTCGNRKEVEEFQKRKYRGKSTKRLNLVCNTCRRTRPEAMRRFFRLGRPVERVNRREVLRFAREVARRRIQKRREWIHMVPEQYAVKLAKLPDRVAAIVGKTYAVMGDGFQI